MCLKMPLSDVPCLLLDSDGITQQFFPYLRAFGIGFVTYFCPGRIGNIDHTLTQQVEIRIRYGDFYQIIRLDGGAGRFARCATQRIFMQLFGIGPDIFGQLFKGVGDLFLFFGGKLGPRLFVHAVADIGNQEAKHVYNQAVLNLEESQKEEEELLKQKGQAKWQLCLKSGALEELQTRDKELEQDIMQEKSALDIWMRKYNGIIHVQWEGQQMQLVVGLNNGEEQDKRE